jgi:hypothetical protein
MAVRINAIPASGFRHGGLAVGKAWTPVEKLTKEQRAALRDFHGRFIRIHPHDVGKLGELGLAFKDAKSPLGDATAKSNTQHNASKGEEKKER